MGPWESAVVTLAALAAVFFAVMGFRGLLEALDRSTGRCVGCERATFLPLPPESHRCWRCHYGVRVQGLHHSEQ
jgi:hypothetical protein